MDWEKTFAYMAFCCAWTPELEAEFADWYWGDFVECSLSFEDQAAQPADVWAYDLDYDLSRIAPVQLILGWDPRPILLEVFARAGSEPIFQGAPQGEGTNWFAFPAPPEPLPWGQLAAPSPPRLADFQRFREVVDTTLEVTRELGQNFVFVGGEGFSYDIDAGHLESAVPVLKQTAMRFFDRHA